jgi:hypothetical protein
VAGERAEALPPVGWPASSRRHAFDLWMIESERCAEGVTIQPTVDSVDDILAGRLVLEATADGASNVNG